jgi:transcriptional regulator with XRE-family HTH domain
VAAANFTLGQIIRRQRELSRMSMRQFATVAGISNPYLSQIERGLRAPSARVLESIAGALEVSVDGLYQEAGIDPEAEKQSEPAVLAAIREDPRLTSRQRVAMCEVYEAFVASSSATSAGAKRRRSTQ